MGINTSVPTFSMTSCSFCITGRSGIAGLRSRDSTRDGMRQSPPPTQLGHCECGRKEIEMVVSQTSCAKPTKVWKVVFSKYTFDFSTSIPTKSILLMRISILPSRKSWTRNGRSSFTGLTLGVFGGKLPMVRTGSVARDQYHTILFRYDF